MAGPSPRAVIPAKAGIQSSDSVLAALDSGLRRNDASSLERDADLRHQDGIVAHIGVEPVGGLIQHRKRPVMARNDQLELEEALAGDRRGPGPHGVAVADRHEADLRPVDLVDQPHVGEDRGVAHMINGLLPGRSDHQAATRAEIDRPPIDNVGGRVPGGDEGQVERVVMQRAAGIAGIDLVDAPAGQIGRKLVHRQELSAGLLADPHRVAGMVLMPVGQGHMGYALDRLEQGNAGLLEGGIAGEEGIDQDAARAAVDAETGMAEPRNLHAFHPLMRLS